MYAHNTQNNKHTHILRIPSVLVHNFRSAYSVTAIVTVIVSSSGAVGWVGDGFISTAYFLPSVCTSLQ